MLSTSKTFTCFFILTASLCPAQTTITTVDAVGAVGLYTAIAISSDGLPIVSYRDETNGDLKVVKCGDSYCSSGNTITKLDTNGNVGSYTSIAVPLDGHPIISYYDATKGDLKVVKCGNPSCSVGNIFTSVDTSGNTGYDPSIIVPADGLPVVAYYDATKSDLKVVKCGDASCSIGNIITAVDTTGSLGYYTSIALSSAGTPVISYAADYPNFTYSLKLLKCANASCSSGNTIVNMDSSFNLIYSTSIAVPSDGLPVVGYSRDLIPGRGLKILKCGNASCTGSNTLRIVDSIWTDYVSLKVPSDGLPVISYFDANRFDLKVLKCGNTLCTGGNIITALDITGNVGSYNSISVPPDGMPVISYIYNNAGDLRVAKCGNPACTTPTDIRRRIVRSEPQVMVSLVGRALTISFSNLGYYRVQMFDITGKSIFEASVSGSDRLVIPDLKPGIHYVRMVAPEGVSTRRVSVY